LTDASNLKFGPFAVILIRGILGKLRHLLHDGVRVTDEQSCFGLGDARRGNLGHGVPPSGAGEIIHAPSFPSKPSSPVAHCGATSPSHAKTGRDGVNDTTPWFPFHRLSTARLLRSSPSLAGGASVQKDPLGKLP